MQCVEKKATLVVSAISFLLSQTIHTELAVRNSSLVGNVFDRHFHCITETITLADTRNVCFWADNCAFPKDIQFILLLIFPAQAFKHITHLG